MDLLFISLTALTIYTFSISLWVILRGFEGNKPDRADLFTYFSIFSFLSFLCVLAWIFSPPPENEIMESDVTNTQTTIISYNSGNITHSRKKIVVESGVTTYEGERATYKQTTEYTFE